MFVHPGAIVIAACDETVFDYRSGLIYVLGAVVFLSDEAYAHDGVSSVIRQRTRPFHWISEGKQARGRMAEAAHTVGAVATCFQQQCGRRRQDQARSELLPHVVRWVTREGADTLYIESRGEELDYQDKRVVKLLSTSHPHIPRVCWDGKQNPLLWMADAVCGAQRELLVSQTHSTSVDPITADLIAATSMSATYISHG